MTQVVGNKLTFVYANVLHVLRQLNGAIFKGQSGLICSIFCFNYDMELFIKED